MNALLKAIKALKDQENAAHSYIEIRSHDPLTKELVDDITSLFEDKIIIRQIIDKKLVSGFAVKYGDMEVDASFDKKFENLEQHLNQNINSADDIIESMKAAIQEFKVKSALSETGSVISVRDGVCFADNLASCMYQELLMVSGTVPGIAMNIEKDRIGIVLLGDATQIKVGDKVDRTNQVISVGVADALLGRVVNPLGQAIDGRGDLEYKKFYPIEKVAPGVITRKPVDKPMLTGIAAIDALIPIGRGQRELILGDRQTGKTSIAIDAIINQKGQDVICIYASIGQKESKLARLVEKLSEAGAMDYTIIVSSPASAPAAMQFITPYSATAIAEYFADQGKDVLIIYDDLSKHAVAYRELSLLLRRPPGREAYPGDVFYLHSRLLERSCNLNEEEGGGSITSLPIIETQAGDISAYIPTNVISITDGQIFLESDLFYKGVRPAINVGLSVSRVGSAAQTKPMKKVAGKLKLSLAQFRELEAFSQFSGDLDSKTREQIERGKKTVELLKQSNFYPVKNSHSVITIFAINNGMFDLFDLSKVKEVNTKFITYTENMHSELVQKLDKNIWDEAVESELKEALKDYLEIIKDEQS